MPKLIVRWRDDAERPWEKEREIELKDGIKMQYIYFYQNGIYRMRQYEIIFTENIPFTLINAEEEVDGLES